MALYLIPRRLETTDVRIVHTLHVEIIVEARDAIADQVAVAFAYTALSLQLIG